MYQHHMAPATVFKIFANLGRGGGDEQPAGLPQRRGQEVLRHQAELSQISSHQAGQAGKYSRVPKVHHKQFFAISQNFHRFLVTRLGRLVSTQDFQEVLCHPAELPQISSHQVGQAGKYVRHNFQISSHKVGQAGKNS